MAKKRATQKIGPSLSDHEISLFDRDNLEFLDALRYNNSQLAATLPASPLEKSVLPNCSETSGADQLFDECKIDDNDERWSMGELNVRIIHRGRIRISRS